MIVALHSAPVGFFETNPPHSRAELVHLVQKAELLGFKAVQVGPLNDYVSLDGNCLKAVLDRLDIKRNVHVGGIYDARSFALTEKEYTKAQKEIHYGVKLCKQLSSTLVSVHPPFFTTLNEVNKELSSEAKMRFFELIRKEMEFASSNGITIALESFCYAPFVFEGLDDFAQFVAEFSPEKLGVLLDVGHVYQVGFSLAEAIDTFKRRLLDIHVHDAMLEKDYRKATHLPIGKGTIDFPWLINLLREAEYEGWLTLEIKGSEGEITRSKEYLENLISKTH